MKQLIYLICTLICFASIEAQVSPQPKKITELFFPEVDSLQNYTPALQKKRGFTDYKELISFLNELKAKQPDWVSIEYIGESQNGLSIPMIRIKTNTTNEKVKVWMQGGLHGNEPASTEGLLYFLYRIINEPSYAELLNDVEFKIVPMANIDGYLKNNRLAANGLDLNRDQTKLMAPETVVLKQAFSDFAPHVALDFHEYNAYRRDFSKMGTFGITSLYDVMFLYSGNLNVPENLRKLTDTLFVENARKKLDEHQLSHYPYVTTSDHYGEISFNKGSVNSRSSATSYALTNCVSTLVEVRGVRLNKTSFKRRMLTAFLIAESFVKTAVEYQTQLKSEIKQAKAPEEVSVISKRKKYTGVLPVIDLDKNEIMEMETVFNDALQSSPKLTRKKPDYYLIDTAQTDLIKKLHILGISSEQLEEERTYTVETFVVEKYEKSDFPYEQMDLQTVETKIQTEQKSFPKGTYLISTQQKNAGLLTETLEPEAPNSFVSFGVLKTELNNTLPIYRLFKN